MRQFIILLIFIILIIKPCIAQNYSFDKMLRYEIGKNEYLRQKVYFVNSSNTGYYLTIYKTYNDSIAADIVDLQTNKKFHFAVKKSTTLPVLYDFTFQKNHKFKNYKNPFPDRIFDFQVDDSDAENSKIVIRVFRNKKRKIMYEQFEIIAEKNINSVGILLRDMVHPYEYEPQLVLENFEVINVSDTRNNRKTSFIKLVEKTKVNLLLEIPKK